VSIVRIDVVSALPLVQVIIALDLPPGATVAQAVAVGCPQFDPAQHTVAIHGQAAALDTALREGDRVEVLRALRVDPKEARRRRQSRRGSAR
jgi:putative ubiquitin-RnfH superfamily antitoxin RatB of RatAB toxin-antitoxin module